MRYITDEGKYPRFVEVKVVGGENSFPISANEVKFGEEKKKHYQIFLVHNINDPDTVCIETIQGPFDYRGRSFYDNDSFAVLNDSYVLKFNKK